MYDEKHLAAQLHPEVINFCHIISTISKDNKLDQELAFNKGIELIHSIKAVNKGLELIQRAQPVSEPVAQPVAQPVSEPPVSEPPVSEPVAQPVSEPIAQPVSEPVSEPEAQPEAQPVSEPPVSELAQPKLPAGFEQSASGIAEVLKNKLSMLQYQKVITKEHESELVEKIDEFAKANVKNNQPFMKPIEVVYNNLLKLKAEFVDHSKLYEADTEDDIKEQSAIYLNNHCKLHKGVYPLKIFMASNMNNKASKWYFSLLAPLFIELRDMFNKGVDWEWLPDSECFKGLNDCSWARPYWVTSIYKWIAKDFFAFNELSEITGIENNSKFINSKYRIHNINDIAKLEETNPFVIEPLEQYNLLAPLFNLETITVA